jgi:pimeloyl-ACP methyl ester carboxylesterase
MHQSLSRVLALMTSLVFLVTALSAPERAVATSGVRCSETNLEVSALGLLPQSVHGQLCVPAGRTPRTVQLLVHGGTYSSRYWDLPYDPDRYSYQRDMAAHGFATFAMDCLGTGKSSMPPSVLLTGAVQAQVIHQVIGQLRSGRVGGVRFDRVVLSGHSTGSGFAVLEASTYHDVDGVVLTGMTHRLNWPVHIRVFVNGVRPVQFDPVLSKRGGDAGYLTTMPGTRGVFHQPGDVDPGVIAADEATKDRLPATVLADTVPVAFETRLSRRIDVPVLIADGQDDPLFCFAVCATPATLRSAEAPFFSPAAQLSVFLLPRTGHAIALSKNAPAYRSAVRDWMTHHIAG